MISNNFNTIISLSSATLHAGGALFYSGVECYSNFDKKGKQTDAKITQVSFAVFGLLNVVLKNIKFCSAANLGITIGSGIAIFYLNKGLQHLEKSHNNVVKAPLSLIKIAAKVTNIILPLFFLPAPVGLTIFVLLATLTFINFACDFQTQIRTNSHLHMSEGFSTPS